ncbi:septal ring lytic transglycosylase RlpA family protein [Methylocapsa palsarum]|uniref:Endolytic peptidoglycan transglycosylase RlpA n=1 Tax=Methylocapsa palsarum TaxID=1612308 RepID=A0A1I3Y9V9_9HYPH|nr:septal ring lytic transglycosylase RlpA family protein [Methylocapsa palsarum]SFK28540.1 rare lipoprotein A [Methylocapsa palsarum]
MRAKLFSCFSSHRFTNLIIRSFVDKAPQRSLFVAGASGFLALSLGGCAQQPALQRTAHSKEYFPSSIYGRASERVVAIGEPAPRGGGVYLVGHPYSVAGQTYYPSEKKYAAVGNASWYGDAFHGRRTANGEVYDCEGITAAHPTMPLPSYARVTNLRNNYSMIVRVNDRGPFASNRIMDVSRATADALDFRRYGTAKVKIEYVGAASLAGSDDRQLLATLRNDGPASLDNVDGATMVAEARPQRTAAAEPAPVKASLEEAVSAADDDAPAAASSGSSRRFYAGAIPTPPARPFDLGTIPGAGVKIAARMRQTGSR